MEQQIAPGMTVALHFVSLASDPSEQLQTFLPTEQAVPGPRVVDASVAFDGPLLPLEQTTTTVAMVETATIAEFYFALWTGGVSNMCGQPFAFAALFSPRVATERADSESRAAIARRR